MPSKCAVLSCPIYAPNKENGMYRIPAVRVRASEELRQLMVQRRIRWGEALRLTDFQMTHALVCGRHFVAGKPSAPEDTTSVDWVPTLNLDVDDLVRRRSMYQPVKQESDTGFDEQVASRREPVGSIETTTATCSIPGCVNRQQKWLTDFPLDKELQQRWLTAIVAGTGRSVLAESGGARAQVCNMHFAAQAPDAIANGAGNGYREPTLFVRDNILIQVVSCRLCMRFETIDNMYNMKLDICDGHSLQWLAKKYFGLFLSMTEFAEEGFFCERCTVQLDMTHVFWREISDKSRKFKWILRKMANERVEFSSKVETLEPVVGVHQEPMGPNSPEVVLIKQEQVDDVGMQVDYDPKLNADQTDQIQSAISQEQFRLTEAPSIHLVKPPPLKIPLNFKCYVCTSRHESKNALIHHLMMDHKDHTALKCDECDVSFKNIMLLNRHLGMHDPTKRIKCSFCPLRFRKSSAKTQHEAARHGDATVANQPGETAGTTTLKEKIKKNQCSQCEKSFLYVSELKRHEKFKHQGEAIARCEICDKAFASNRNLSRHLKLHREDAKADNLTTRNRKAAVISCNLCDVALANTREMTAHLKQSHPDAEVKTYACQQCDQVFLSQTSLLNHGNIHSDAFGCELCGKRHCSKTMLQRHRLKKHGIDMDDDQYVTCPVCEKRFYKGGDYARHEQSHQKEKFPCGTCGRSFGKKELLEKHERVHCEENPHECAACGLKFGSSASLSRHKKICATMADHERKIAQLASV